MDRNRLIRVTVQVEPATMVVPYVRVTVTCNIGDVGMFGPALGLPHAGNVSFNTTNAIRASSSDMSFGD